jgi:ribosomal protein S18 acetylase RimI-like enzyme
MHKIFLPLIKKIENEDASSIEVILRKIEEFNERDISTCLYVFEGIKKGEYEGFSAYVENKLIGFIFFSKNSLGKDVYELLWIVVDPDYQRFGIGSLLMEKFLEEMKKRGARLIILHTSEHYLKAKKLYEKYNFKCEGKIKDFYSVGDSKEIWVLRF